MQVSDEESRYLLKTKNETLRCAQSDMIHLWDNYEVITSVVPL